MPTQPPPSVAAGSARAATSRLLTTSIRSSGRGRRKGLLTFRGPSRSNSAWSSLSISLRLPLPDADGTIVCVDDDRRVARLIKTVRHFRWRAGAGGHLAAQPRGFGAE